jgi:hypothetical protein
MLRTQKYLGPKHRIRRQVDLVPAICGTTSRWASIQPRTEKDLKTQSVPRSKHTPFVIKTRQLMLYREIIVVCSEIHTKHINTLCGQNVELLNVKLVVHIVTAGLYI